MRSRVITVIDCGVSISGVSVLVAVGALATKPAPGRSGIHHLGRRHGHGGQFHLLLRLLGQRRADRPAPIINIAAPTDWARLGLGLGLVPVAIVLPF